MPAAAQSRRAAAIQPGVCGFIQRRVRRPVYRITSKSFKSSVLAYSDRNFLFMALMILIMRLLGQ
ncbi:hypothetical protein BN134_1782 [Cronobacter dublinensis 1210]|uniref:Uncharacterized protein n=1 Tax=Cronobacter dublinensis 1210 TaxID=1208656 RepID=A0ABM9Q6F9_9ENTR|nr:hypothetical protein BN134_1782 [Cronobacter dublinensis 1210]